MIEIILALLMLLYAPIPWITILAHVMVSNKKKVSIAFITLIAIISWIILSYFTYTYFHIIFIQRFNNVLLKVFGIVILLAAFIIESQSRKQLGTSRILGSSEFKKKEGKLVTSGVYKFARHPRYVEHPLLFLGFGLIFGYYILLWFSLYLFLSFSITAYFEEKELLKRFGKAYSEYKKRTPAFFIPFNR